MGAALPCALAPAPRFSRPTVTAFRVGQASRPEKSLRENHYVDSDLCSKSESEPVTHAQTRPRRPGPGSAVTAARLFAAEPKLTGLGQAGACFWAEAALNLKVGTTVTHQHFKSHLTGNRGPASHGPASCGLPAVHWPRPPVRFLSQ